MDAGRKGGGVLEAEARGEERGVEEEEDEVLDGLVVLVCGDLLAELRDDGVVGVDLERLLAGHVGGHAGVAERLRLHDALHVGGPAVLGGHEGAGRGDEALGDEDLLDLVREDVLDRLAEALVELLLLGLLLLLLLGLLELEVLLGDAHELVPVKVLELLDGVLVDGLRHVEHLEVAALEALDEGRRLDGLLALAGDVVDVLLALLHAGDVVLERGHLVVGLGRVEAEQLGELGAVLGVLVDPELEVLAERLVERLEVVLVLGDLAEQLEALLHEVLADDLQDLVLLEHLTRDVEGEVLGVDHALDEPEPLGDELAAVVRDEHAAHVQLDVVGLLLALEEVEGRAAGDEQHRAELELALDGEVLDGEVVLPVVGDGLVERGVLLLGDLGGVADPQRLLLVDLDPLVRDDLLLLGLLLLLLLVLILNFTFLCFFLYKK